MGRRKLRAQGRTYQTGATHRGHGNEGGRSRNRKQLTQVICKVCVERGEWNPATPGEACRACGTTIDVLGRARTAA
jgi:hypothetical protein